MTLSTLTQLPIKIWNRDKLSILIYHRVLSRPDPYWANTVTVNEFRAQMRLVRRYFNPIGLPEAVKGLKEGSLPARALAITFDDGYADNATNAVPILQELGLTATFFIATDFINGGAMWLNQIVEAIRQYDDDIIDLSKIGFNQTKTATFADKKQLLSEILPALRHMEMCERDDKTAFIIEQAGKVNLTKLMLNNEQILAMDRAEMTIGAHTQGHPNLHRTSPEKSMEEISESKKVLERIIDKKVSLFAYPFGKENLDFSALHATQVKELGFNAAVTTDVGVSNRNSDLYRLPRFTPWDRNGLKFTLRLAANHVSQASHAELDHQ